MSRESYIRGFLKAAQAIVAARKPAVKPVRQAAKTQPVKPVSPVLTDADFNTEDIVKRINQGIDLALPFAKKWEKYKQDAYLDKVSNKMTVGYGLTSIPDKDPKTGKFNMLGKWRPVRAGDKLTEAESDMLMKHVMRNNASKMYSDLKWTRTLEPRSLAALYDIAYNGGVNLLYDGKSPNLNKIMNAADWRDRDRLLVKELPTYRKSNGKVVKGLENRRRAAVLAFAGMKRAAEIAAFQRIANSILAKRKAVG